MKSILRNPTRKEKRNAHKRACSAAGMSAEDRAEWGAGDPAEHEDLMLSEEIEGNDNAEKERLTTDFIAELSAVSRMERLARIWHEGTYRSGRLSDVPYVEHPADVVAMLKSWGYDEKEDAVTLAVAWGHDLLEDTAIGEARIYAVLGDGEVPHRIVEGIKMLTFHPSVGNDDPEYGRQKAAYISHVAHEATPEILPVKMADRICNTLDFYKCGEIRRARTYLGCADEVFEMIGVTKYPVKIEETLTDCRKLVDKFTLGERVAGLIKRARKRISI